MSRVLGTVVSVQTAISTWPTVPVVMHDEDESMPDRVLVLAINAARPDWISAPREVREARASLPDTPCTDWFAHYGEAGRG